MRILIMVHNLTGGGAERVASLWATGFQQRGHEVGMILNCNTHTPVTYKIPATVKMYNLCTNEIIAWGTGKLYRKLHIDYYYVCKIKKIISEYQPDVIICVLHPWAEWTRKATTGLNIPIINTEHNSFERPKDSELTKIMWQQKYEWNKRYDHVTVLTNADKLCVNKVLSNVSVLPNPLVYTPISQLPNKEKIILAAGRLDAWHVKGFDLLIKAWSKLSKNYSEWKLQIAGNSKGLGKDYLQSIASELNLGSQLEFIGYQNDMLPVYRRASVFVLSSRYEGFGMVLIEAMSQGCASIACDYKGRQREIITSNQEGVICPADDIDSLANAMQAVISNEEYMNKLQLNAIERSKYFSLDNTMDRWESIFKKVGVNNI